VADVEVVSSSGWSTESAIGFETIKEKDSGGGGGGGGGAPSKAEGVGFAIRGSVAIIPVLKAQVSLKDEC
jgi:hypothetical protein